MPSKKPPSRPREYASDAAFKKRPGKSPFKIGAAQPPPKKKAKPSKKARKRAASNAARNRAAGSKGFLERRAQAEANARAAANRAAGSRAVLERNQARAQAGFPPPPPPPRPREFASDAPFKKKPAKKKPAKKAAKKRASRSKTCPPCPPCPPGKKAKRGAKKGAKKAASKRGAARRAPKSKCVDGKVPFLFAVATSKRCKKGTRLGDVVTDNGIFTGLEVRAVKVRCGGGNRKVACGGVAS